MSIRPIRPPDSAIVGTTMTYMGFPPRTASAEACRRLTHLVFRDAHTALDLTYAHRGFWSDPLPPGLTVTSNNLDPDATAELHLDFTATGLPAGAFDFVTYDPPHVADAGADSIIGRRFGTVRGMAALRELIEAGAREAWRVARIGVLVKLADHSHQGQYQLLSDWVKAAIPMQPYTVMHTYRAMNLESRHWKSVRVPRNNGAIYLVFRKDSHRHKDFDAMFARQEARARRGAA